MKNIKSNIVLIAMIIVTQLTYGQNSRSNTPLEIKDILIQYQECFDIEEVQINKTKLKALLVESEFRTKVVNEFNADVDSVAEIIPLIDYYTMFNDYFDNHEIRGLQLYNDKVEKINHAGGYDIYQISVLKEVIHKKKSMRRSERFAPPDTLRNQLIFTIISYNIPGFVGSKQRIVKISNQLENYSPIYIQSITGALTPGRTFVSDNAFDTEGRFAFGGSLQMNFPITGIGRNTLFISPGVGFGNYSSDLIVNSLVGSYNHTDIDNFEYTRHFEAQNIFNQYSMSMVYVPVDLKVVRYFNNFRLNLYAGLEAGFPLNNLTSDIEGTVEYYGEYNFGTENEPWIVELKDLEKYGFSNYAASLQTSEVNINKFVLNSRFGVNLELPISKRTQLDFGAKYTLGLNTFYEENPQFTVEDGVVMPILALGEAPMISALSMNIGLSYDLTKPRIPYSKALNRKAIKRVIQDDKLRYRRVDVADVYRVPTEKAVSLISLMGPKYELDGLKKVRYEYVGAGMKNDKQGKLKIKPKVQKLNLPVPIEDEAREKAKLRIKKPFSYNIYYDVADEDQNNEYLEIGGSNLLTAQQKSINLKVAKIPTYNFVYVNLFSEMSSTTSMRERLFDYIRNDLYDARRNDEDGILYLSLAEEVFYNDLDSLDRFMGRISLAQADKASDEIADIEKAMASGDVKLGRRKINLIFYVFSKDIFENEVMKVIKHLLEREDTRNNWENITLTVYVDSNFDSKFDRDNYNELYRILKDNLIPVYKSNWTIKGIK